MFSCEFREFSKNTFSTKHLQVAASDICKNGLNLTNLEKPEALKDKIPATWSAMPLNHFKFDVIWIVFQLILKLHSHMTVLWCFYRIFVISQFSLLSVGLKTKTRKSRKIFNFLVFSCQVISNGSLILFLVVDNAITLFNCFFRDFRGFWGFDLALLKIPFERYMLSFPIHKLVWRHWLQVISADSTLR